MPVDDLPAGLVVRELAASDSLAELTALLHRAYAGLARRGLRYVATFQDEETTRGRIDLGVCLVALLDRRLVGTITFRPRGSTAATGWYRRPGVASCGQLGVDPEFQGRGIGSLLMDLVEERAWTSGANEMALDTSDQADDLIAFYAHRGYRFVEKVDWEATNYESVVLSKCLTLPEVVLREIPDGDEAVLASLLVEATNWDASRPRISSADVLARPELRRYVEDWGRPGDAGFLAEDGAGAVLGGAWLRTYAASRPAYGFVAEDVPEISIAVRRPWRDHGLGARLLAALRARAVGTGVTALSLNVEDGNPAARLYRRVGFRTVAHEGGARTMVVPLAVELSPS